MLNRRDAVGGFLGAAVVPGGLASAARVEAGPQDALLAFLRAFENCDLPRMEAAFARDATCFDRAPADPGDLAPYHRAAGMPPGMRHLALTLPKTVPGPPYHRVDPQGLACVLHGDIALCTFELEDADNLGRRTVVLRHEADAWKIIHIHASNIYLAPRRTAAETEAGSAS